MHFVDNSTGWAVGDSGVIIRTTDGGQNWAVQNSNVSSDIVNIFFLDRRTGWALTWRNQSPPYGTTILETTNGGEVWRGRQHREENVFMNTVFFHDSLTGWMGGFGGAFARTTDGGQEWREVQPDTQTCANLPILHFAFYNRDYAFACGGLFDLSGAIWKTTNRGQNWIAQCVSPEPVQKLHIFDSLNIVGVGGDFEFGSSVVRTTDGGVTWNYTFLEVFGIATALSFRTASEGWSTLGVAQELIYTSDAGTTWTNIPTPGGTIVFDLVFTDSLHGYAVGHRGVILNYTPTPVNVDPPATATLPSKNRLLQNYPNPFNPSTLIEYELAENSYVVLEVFDLSGKKVARLEQGVQKPGVYAVAFSSAGLPSGVYFYTLITDPPRNHDRRTRQTKKMILLK